MRPMVAAGELYPADPKELQKGIESAYADPRGPGDLPLQKQGEQTTAFIVPDGAYRLCAPCMAWGYKTLAETPIVDVYVVVAAGKLSGITLEGFQTPLGVVRVDQELAKAIAERGTVSISDHAHREETSIEVQLPFLLHAKHLEIEKVKILPVLVNEETDLHQLALDIKELCLDLKRKAVIIASASLTHFGPLFKSVPFSFDIRNSIYTQDKHLLELIKSKDAKAFAIMVAEKMVCLPGTPAIELLLRLNPGAARVEQYYTSGDVLEDFRNSVSYAAVVFEKK